LSYLFQFFESTHKELLQQAMNEFSSTILDPKIFEIVEIRLQEPNWDRAMIVYRARKSPEEMQKIALAELEQERLKKEAEQNKQYSDEELKEIADKNKNEYYEGMKELEAEDPEFHKRLLDEEGTKKSESTN
jgi:predicted transcriptional regulator